MYRIFPSPKQCAFSGGSLRADVLFLKSMDPSIADSCEEAGCSPEKLLARCTPRSSFPFSPGSSRETENISVPVFVSEIPCPPEGFHLSVTAAKVLIECSTGAGFFYAANVLFQLAVQGSGSIPCVEITDYPSLSVRGIILDIGRDKIPSMETLYHLMDLFGDMRINHLQLYMEGFCFDYEQFRYLFTDETPVTPEQFQALSAYAKARFIDLVPNQNVLGHMDRWLEKPQFRSLAECEEGYLFENLYRRPPMTLDPRDEKGFELARNLLDVLLDNSDSGYINVNMDEPFELGMGKNKEYADRHGKLSLYFDYMEKLHSYCLNRNRKMMMWGDEVLRAPEYVSRFPKDVILLDWIYEGDAHFEEHARLMQSTGLQFCLCPGTSSWGSLTGRSANMACNIRDAASCAIRYGGLGIITTDWGDQGHWQYISASYPAFAHTGLYAWSGPGDEDSLIFWYCNRFLYESPDESAYQAAWDLGNYYRLENAPLYNTTLAFAVMSSKYTFDSIEEFDQKMDRLLKLSANIARSNKIPPRPQVISIDYDVLFSYLEKVDDEIEHAQILCQEGDLIRREMKNGLRMVRHGIRLYHALKELRNDSTALGEEMKVLYDDLDDIMKEHYWLWSTRNRSGGFGRSTNHMNHLLEFYRRSSQL